MHHFRRHVASNSSRTCVSRVVFSNIRLLAYWLTFPASFAALFNGRQYSSFLLSYIPHFFSRDEEISGDVRGLSDGKHLLNFHDALRALFDGSLLLVDLSIPQSARGLHVQENRKAPCHKAPPPSLLSLFSCPSFVSLERQFSALRKTVVREVKGGERR